MNLPATVAPFALPHLKSAKQMRRAGRAPGPGFFLPVIVLSSGFMDGTEAHADMVLSRFSGR
jgi:hypothetical protein